jgi:hypothetical protein
MSPLLISALQCRSLMGNMHRNTFRNWAKRNGLKPSTKTTRIAYFKIEDFAKASGLSIPAIEHQLNKENTQ